MTFLDRQRSFLELAQLHSLAGRSASMMRQPRSRQIRDTVLFPVATPPVRPTSRNLRFSGFAITNY